MSEKENRITRLNYSPRVKGLFACGIITAFSLVAQVMDRSPRVNIPLWLRGHLFDICTVPAAAPAVKVLFGEDDLAAEVKISLWLAFTVESGQGAGFIPGIFDPGDYIFYLAGVPLWIVFDKSAKLLYDSGVTKPLYRLLQIQDRRK